MRKQDRERLVNIKSTVFIIALLDALALTLIIPILPLYGARLGGDPFAIGLISAAYPFTQLLGAPLMGALSDRFGRKPILLFSLLGSFVGYVIMIMAQSLPMLIVARMVDGLSGGNVATAYAMLADVTPPEDRSRTFGMVVGSAFGIGFIVGPLITIAILTTTGDSYALVATVAAFYAVLAMFITWKMLPETRAQQAQPRTKTRVGAWINAPIILLLVALAFQQFAFGGFERLLSLFNLTTLGIGATGTGYLFIYIGLLVVWVQARAIKQFAPRVGERRMAADGFLALAVGLCLLALTPAVPSPWFNREALQAALSGSNTTLMANPTTASLQISLPSGTPGWAGLGWLLMALVPVSLGGAVLRPVLNSLLSQQVAPQHTGAMLGISSAVISAMNAAAPLVGGVLFGLSPTYPFLLGASAAVLGFAAFVGLVRWRAALTPT